MDDVIEKIKDRRKELKISQRELAELVGISQNFYSTLETGKSRLTVELLEIIAKALNCKPSDFLGDDDDVELPSAAENTSLRVVRQSDDPNKITFRYSEKDRQAEIHLPKDIDPALLEIAIDRAAASVKNSPTTEVSGELVLKPAVGGEGSK